MSDDDATHIIAFFRVSWTFHARPLMTLMDTSQSFLAIAATPPVWPSCMPHVERREEGQPG
jgi:hypothetical protein